MIKKVFKMLLTFIAVIIVLVIVLLAISLRLVDSRHYSETDYYRNTVARIDSILAGRADKSETQLFLGAGKAGITPQVGVPLAGYGARKGAPSTGVHDSLFVRVLALEAGEQQAFIIGYDALLLHPPIARRLEAKVKNQFAIPAEQLYFTATHTHSGPGGWGESWLDQQFAGPPDSTVSIILIDSTLAALKRAIKNKKAASFTAQKVDAPRFIRNRLVGEQGQVDDDLFLISFWQNNMCAGALATYSAHATVMSANNMALSGDYPGTFERKLENTLNSTVLFAAAGLGSHSNRSKGQGFDRAAFVGEGLADSALVHIHDQSPQSRVTLRAFRIPVDLAKPQVRLTQKICLAPWLAKKLLHPNQCYLQVLALNDFVLIGSPGEFSGELALRVKTTASEEDKLVSITSFNGCYIGYVTPSEYASMDEYETKLMSWFGAYTGDYLTDLMQQILRKL